MGAGLDQINLELELFIILIIRIGENLEPAI